MPRWLHFVSALFLSGLVCSGLSACGSRPRTLQDVVEQNTRITGGRVAIEAVRSIEVNLHIVDPGFEADGIYRAMRPGKMRIDVNVAGKHVFTEATDGVRGWDWKGKGEPVECSPAATAALKRGAQLPGKLFGLHEMSALGNQLQLAGRECIANKNYDIVRLTLPDGFSSSLYVDAQNGLITRRRETRALHVDLDPTPTTIETQTSDFRRIAGVLFSFESAEIDLKTGKTLERATIRSIKVDPPLDEGIFAKL